MRLGDYGYLNDAESEVFSEYLMKRFIPSLLIENDSEVAGAQRLRELYSHSESEEEEMEEEEEPLPLPQSQAAPKPQVTFEIKPESKTEIKPKSKVETMPKSKVEVMPKSKTEIKPKVEVNTNDAEEEFTPFQSEWTQFQCRPKGKRKTSSPDFGGDHQLEFELAEEEEPEEEQEAEEEEKEAAAAAVPERKPQLKPKKSKIPVRVQTARAANEPQQQSQEQKEPAPRKTKIPMPIKENPRARPRRDPREPSPEEPAQPSGASAQIEQSPKQNAEQKKIRSPRKEKDVSKENGVSKEKDAVKEKYVSKYVSNVVEEKRPLRNFTTFDKKIPCQHKPHFFHLYKPTKEDKQKKAWWKKPFVPVLPERVRDDNCQPKQVPYSHYKNYFGEEKPKYEPTENDKKTKSWWKKPFVPIKPSQLANQLYGGEDSLPDGMDLSYMVPGQHDHLYKQMYQPENQSASFDRYAEYDESDADMEVAKPQKPKKKGPAPVKYYAHRKDHIWHGETHGEYHYTPTEEDKQTKSWWKKPFVPVRPSQVKQDTDDFLDDLPEGFDPANMVPGEDDHLFKQIFAKSTRRDEEAPASPEDDQGMVHHGRVTNSPPIPTAAKRMNLERQDRNPEQQRKQMVPRPPSGKPQKAQRIRTQPQRAPVKTRIPSPEPFDGGIDPADMVPGQSDDFFKKQYMKSAQKSSVSYSPEKDDDSGMVHKKVVTNSPPLPTVAKKMNSSVPQMQMVPHPPAEKRERRSNRPDDRAVKIEQARRAAPVRKAKTPSPDPFDGMDPADMIPGEDEYFKKLYRQSAQKSNIAYSPEETDIPPVAVKPKKRESAPIRQRAMDDTVRKYKPARAESPDNDQGMVYGPRTTNSPPLPAVTRQMKRQEMLSYDSPRKAADWNNNVPLKAFPKPENAIEIRTRPEPQRTSGPYDWPKPEPEQRAPGTRVFPLHQSRWTPSPEPPKMPPASAVCEALPSISINQKVSRTASDATASPRRSRPVSPPTVLPEIKKKSSSNWFTRLFK